MPMRPHVPVNAPARISRDDEEGDDAWLNDDGS